MLDVVHWSVWCMTWFFHLSYAWRGLIIGLMHDMVLLSAVCLTWSYYLSYAWHGRLFFICLIHLHTLPLNDICNACWHAINHWCNRGSIRSLECSDSLQLVATWCKMVLMIEDSDGDIHHSLSHASLNHSYKCWDCWHVTYRMSSSLQDHHHHWTAALSYSIERVASDVRWRRWLWWWWLWLWECWWWLW